MRNFPPRLTARKTFIATVLESLIVFLGIGVAAQSPHQPDWNQRSADDVKQILSKSPWVSHCCWAGPEGTSTGYEALIESSQIVRQALVRSMQLDKRYQKLDSAHRQDLDQRIAACVNEKFDDQIVFWFNIVFADGPDPGESIDQIHLLTSDGRKIVGHELPDSLSIRLKCGSLRNEHFPGARPYDNEIAFPRYVDGKPTFNPADRTIRIDLDFYRKTWPGHTVGELDFDIDKLVYQGGPDY